MLSVIMPVYQAEKYLETSIESVLNQTLRDLELLLVDDGSTDRSPAICDAYAQKDPRVRVIHQKNSGVAGARNAGLDAACGEWIMWLDSDDILHPAIAETLLSLAAEKQLSAVWCSFLNMSPDGVPVYTDQFPSMEAIDKTLSSKSFSFTAMNWQEAASCLYTMGELSTVTVVPWAKVCRSELYNGAEKIRYPEGEPADDSFVFYRLIHTAQKLGRIDTPLCFYRETPESLSRNNEAALFASIVRASRGRFRFYLDKGEEELYRTELLSVMQYHMQVYGRGKDRTLRKAVKQSYGELYRNEFQKQKWKAAKRLRMWSFYKAHALYALICFASSFRK